ncbi:MAG: putative DNA-binding regulatory protein [Deltaproteobacteria bacterium]|nr:putative DNA-binding regulatory protein [Deltaproteobacteria bacterium]
MVTSLGLGAGISDQTIAEAWATGRAAFTALAVPLDAFTIFAREREASWAGATDRAADLYLACACAAAGAGAAELFFARFGDRIPAYLGRLGSDRDLVDEVRQIVLVRCLLGEADRPPAITTYSGRGSLEGWVRATAVREAIALQRDRARHLELAAPGTETPSEQDHALAQMIGHYREPVMRAFTAAVGALPREHRTLLRLHYVHALTTADLAKMFRISRATLVRRIADARDGLFELLQGALFGQAGVPPEDCESVLRLVKSQVDLRLSSLLRETAA